MNVEGRVIVVSELFYPDDVSTAHIMTCIADYIGQIKEVLVISGSKNALNEKTKKNDNKKYKINRVWTPNLNKANLIQRILMLIIISFELSWLVLIKSNRRDIIFSVTNPAPMLILLSLLKKIKKYSYVLLVHDIFPENVVATGMISKNNLIVKLIKFLFDWAYRIADSIIVIGRDMAEIVEAKIGSSYKSKIKIIENWSELSIVEPILRNLSYIPKLGLENNIVFEYAGNIGRAQGLVEFVEACKLVNNNKVHFLFAGAGALSSVIGMQLSNIKNSTLLGRYSRIEQGIILGSCDIALVLLGRGMYGLGVPSKVYNIMAAGKPILYIGPKDSEVYRLINDHHIGWAFDWDNINKVIDFINSIRDSDLKEAIKIGLNARRVAEKFYNEAIAMKKFESVIIDNNYN